NLPEALNGSEKVHRQRLRAWNGRHGQGRVLVLRQVGRAISRSVEAAPLQQMLARRAYIGNIQYRLERQLILDAEVVGVGGRNLALAVDGDQAGRREQRLSRAHLLYPPEKERRLEGGRRVLHQVKNRVALRAVVEDTCAAAHDQSLIAERVISE